MTTLSREEQSYTAQTLRSLLHFSTDEEHQFCCRLPVLGRWSIRVNCYSFVAIALFFKRDSF